MTKPFDRARSIYEGIEVHVYGPLGSETPACAEALTTAGLIAELHNRVEALESAQRPTQVNADISRRPWAAMSYRGVMLLPPIDCADDADLWIADRIYEMGLADGRNATTGNTAPVTRDRAEDAPASSDSLVEQVACAISGCGNIGPINWWTPEARAAILTVADWFDQQDYHGTAARLRMEVRG